MTLDKEVVSDRIAFGAFVEEEEVEDEETAVTCDCCGRSPVALKASIPRFGFALNVLAQLCKSLFLRRFDLRASSSIEKALLPSAFMSTGSSLCKELIKASKQAAALNFIDSGNGGTRAPLSPILLKEFEKEVDEELLTFPEEVELDDAELLLLFETPSAAV